MNQTEELKLNKVLSQLIREKGITLTSLSRFTKVPVQTLHGWLQGSKPKHLHQLKSVANYFDVDLDFLCFGTKKIEPSIMDFEYEISTGIYEVILRRIKK